MKGALTFLTMWLLVDLLAFSLAGSAEASWRSTGTSVANPNAVYCKGGGRKADISQCKENRKGPKQKKRNSSGERNRI
jgi:putative hemolysin